jgi:prophage tail gpP-like protein
MNVKINDRIKVRNIEFFNNFSLSLRYDSVASSFGFNFFFDPTNPDHRELACVSHYHEAIVEHNGQKLLTGYILNEALKSSSVDELVGFNGYSLPGVLEDCSIPPELYPLQSDGLTLAQIADKLITPFKLKYVIDPAVASRMNKVYEKTTAKESQTIKDYLKELAAQRNIVITHDATGQVIFTEAKTDRPPIISYETGMQVFTDLALNFDGQQLHSHITVMKQADSKGGNTGQYTIRNPYVPIVYRPTVIIQSSGDDNDTKDVAVRALANELKNIKFTITMDSWEIDGKLVLPNSMLKVKCPRIFLYKSTDLFIEQIDYKGDNISTTATLHCVLPEVYNGKEPKNVFVDPHQNFPRL